MAVVDVFYFRGDWVKIHVDLKVESEHRFYSITAKDEHDALFNGFEYRLNALGDGDPCFLLDTPEITRLIAQARKDVEDDRWDAHLKSIAGLDSKQKTRDAYDEGRKAFRCKCNHHTNPYDEDTDEADQWMNGWADEFDENPAEFNEGIGNSTQMKNVGCLQGSDIYGASSPNSHL